MTNIELEALKQTFEYKAADALADAHNKMGFRPKKFAEALARQHRTIQQNIFRSIVEIIICTASDEYETDQRNEASHKLAKRIIDSGALNEHCLPYI